MDYSYENKQRVFHASKTGNFEKANKRFQKGAGLLNLTLGEKYLLKTCYERSRIFVYVSPVLSALKAHKQLKTDDSKKLLTLLLNQSEFPIKHIASVFIRSTYKEQRGYPLKQEQNEYVFSAADFVRICRKKQNDNTPGASYLKPFLTDDVEILKSIERQIKQYEANTQKKSIQPKQVAKHCSNRTFQKRNQIGIQQRRLRQRNS